MCVQQVQKGKITIIISKNWEHLLLRRSCGKPPLGRHAVRTETSRRNSGGADTPSSREPNNLELTAERAGRHMRETSFIHVNGVCGVIIACACDKCERGVRIGKSGCVRVEESLKGRLDAVRGCVVR